MQVNNVMDFLDVIVEKSPNKIGYVDSKRKITFEHAKVEEEEKIEIVKLSAEEEAQVKKEQDQKVAEKIKDEEGKK